MLLSHLYSYKVNVLLECLCILPVQGNQYLTLLVNRIVYEHRTEYLWVMSVTAVEITYVFRHYKMPCARAVAFHVKYKVTGSLDAAHAVTHHEPDGSRSLVTVSGHVFTTAFFVFAALSSVCLVTLVSALAVC